MLFNEQNDVPIVEATVDMDLNRKYPVMLDIEYSICAAARLLMLDRQLLHLASVASTNTGHTARMPCVFA
eukprot:COSAG02_NODE_1541_length_12013_cov_16.409182_6_plen_70_part_00